MEITAKLVSVDPTPLMTFPKAPASEEEELEELRGLYASPLAANGFLYVVGREGTTAVLKDSESFEVIRSERE